MKTEINNPAVPVSETMEEEVMIVEEESRGRRILNAVVNTILVIAIAQATSASTV